MRRAVEDYAGALLHRTRWTELGAHSRDLASDAFTTVFPGMHTLTDHPASFNAMAWALQYKVVDGCVLSHSTAAVFWGIPIPIQLDNGVGRLWPRRNWPGKAFPRIPTVLPDESLRGEATLPPLHCRGPEPTPHRVGRGVTIHQIGRAHV